MNIALWVAAGLLAFVFLTAGLTKIVQPRQKLYDSGLAYVEDFPTVIVKTIGVLEVLGALGVILPGLLDVAPVLVPVAAGGLAAAMACAVIVHVRRREPFITPLGFGLLALFVAVFRFGAHAL